MSEQSKMNVSLDFRVISAVLAAIIIGMLALWRPWTQQYDSDARTVSVTGEAVVKATPDEYAFWPSYQFKSTDKAAALKSATDKTNEVVAKLKEMGVKDTAIKTDVNGYNGPDEASKDMYVYTGTVTATVGDKDLAQKVQDYLVATNPEGSVTPQPTFSDAKRKQLESEARDQATKNARSKADQSAKNLGFTIDKIKTVNDGVGFGSVPPMYGATSRSMVAEDTASSLVLQPGENDLPYSVTVEYYIR